MQTGCFTSQSWLVVEVYEEAGSSAGAIEQTVMIKVRSNNTPLHGLSVADRYLANVIVQYSMRLFLIGRCRAWMLREDRRLDRVANIQLSQNRRQAGRWGRGDEELLGSRQTGPESRLDRRIMKRCDGLDGYGEVRTEGGDAVASAKGAKGLTRRYRRY